MKFSTAEDRALVRSVQRVAAESRLGLGGVFGEEIQEEAVRLFPLAPGRLKEAAIKGFFLRF